MPNILPIVVGFIIASPALAGEESVTERGAAESAAKAADLELESVPWRFSITPYVWMPGQHGTITSHGKTGTVDMDVSDAFNMIKDNFSGALAFHAEVSKGSFSAFADVMYLNLENSTDTQVGTAHASYTQGIYELGGAYAVTGAPTPTAAEMASFTFEPLLGVRLYDADSTILGPAGDVTANGSQSWADLFVGVRGSVRLNRTFGLFARGDIGAGGSDLAWNVLGGLDVNLATWFSLQLGYRWLDIDYSDGSGTDQFAYDMQLAGPFLGLSFRF